MPTLTKFLKKIHREDQVTTTDPYEIAQLKAQGYREQKPASDTPDTPAVPEQVDDTTVVTPVPAETTTLRRATPISTAGDNKKK